MQPTSVVRVTRISPGLSGAPSAGDPEHPGRPADQPGGRAVPLQDGASEGLQAHRRGATDEGGLGIGPRQVARVLGAAELDDASEIERDSPRSTARISSTVQKNTAGMLTGL